MALEGTIEEFGVADILQLAAQQQKSGVLLVQKGDEQAEVFFLDGEIAETRSTHPRIRHPLGEMLVRARLLSEDGLKRVLEKQRNSYEYLGQILVREGLINRENLERAILAQIYETFYDILQWRKGTYRFIPQKVTVDHGLSPMLSLQSILLDVLRMIDEWPDIEKTISSFSVVFRPAAEKIPGDLDDEELLVYNLVDGTNTVREIVDQSLMGRFTACKVLAGLFDRGCIAPASAGPSRKKAPRGPSYRQAVRAASCLGLAAVLAALLFLPTGFPGTALPLLDPAAQGRQYFDGFLTTSISRKLETALEMYRFQKGTYPGDVAELAAAGILDGDDVQSCADRSISYSLQGRSYTITVRD